MRLWTFLYNSLTIDFYDVNMSGKNSIKRSCFGRGFSIDYLILEYSVSSWYTSCQQINSYSAEHIWNEMEIILNVSPLYNTGI